MLSFLLRVSKEICPLMANPDAPKAKAVLDRVLSHTAGNTEAEPTGGCGVEEATHLQSLPNNSRGVCQHSQQDIEQRGQQRGRRLYAVFIVPV